MKMSWSLSTACTLLLYGVMSNSRLTTLGFKT